jgi:Raf kinase inhibitor-like YbhB/YbcL family protein
MPFALHTSDFINNDVLPIEYSYKGPNHSPELWWSEPPPNTKSFVLIMDDPDAPMGTWVHWVVYNIPLAKERMEEHFPRDKELKDKTRQGVNDFGNIGYDGPSPPKGTNHRYFFTLYAIDTILDLPPGATKQDVLKAISGHILAKTELMGWFPKK